MSILISSRPDRHPLRIPDWLVALRRSGDGALLKARKALAAPLGLLLFTPLVSKLNGIENVFPGSSLEDVFVASGLAHYARRSGDGALLKAHKALATPLGLLLFTPLVSKLNGIENVFPGSSLEDVFVASGLAHYARRSGDGEPVNKV